MNIFSAVKKGFEILNRENIKSAQLDAEILMAQAINKNREFVIINDNKISLSRLDVLI